MSFVFRLSLRKTIGMESISFLIMSMDKLILTSLFVLRIPFIRIVGLTVLLLSLNVTNSLMIHYKMSLKRILSTCKGKKITNILWNSVD